MELYWKKLIILSLFYIKKFQYEMVVKRNANFTFMHALHSNLIKIYCMEIYLLIFIDNFTKFKLIGLCRWDDE